MEECQWMLTDQVYLINLGGHRIVLDIRKPLPLVGPPGQVTIQSQYFFNKDLEYLVLGDKGRRSALSISKLKVAHYLDFGLKELVLSLWIKSECEYDISVAYGQLNHLSGDDKVHLFNAVNMWIRNIVIRKRIEDLQLGIESYQTKLNLTQLDWDASNFLFKEDYTIVSKPRADHMVKDFRLFKYNSSMTTKIWSKGDKKRSKEFMEVIEHRLKLQRIFRSLESFVGVRLRDVDYKLIQRTE
nr:hypothetical protein [Tanacetum cinerariifolium]